MELEQRGGGEVVVGGWKGEGGEIVRLNHSSFEFLRVLQVLENLDALTSLTSLFVGKNKITKLQGLDALVKLQTLSIQVR